jgi:soluble lytic murein transglycosylase-like protein
VPKSFVYAIMRQESGFRPAATSSAAARGLMQVIAPTALEIARALDDLGEGETEVAFDDPSRNVRYGVYYLGNLLRTFGEHPALAAAGYNAGPAAAGLWFHKGQELPLEMFVAQIPFDETRTYVMRVLSNLAAYQLLDPELGKIDIPLSLR